MNHKTFLRHAMALGVAFACLSYSSDALSAQQPPPPLKHGDVNGDGVVSALDAQAILSAVVGLTLPGNFIIANGVSNCDGRTLPAALDAQIVLSFVIGLNTSAYCVGQAFGAGAVAIDMSPRDSSLLINRGMMMKATLKDANGFLIRRPIAWSSSNPAIVTIDSVKGDSLAFVKAGSNQGSTQIQATSDGVSFITQLKVFLSYAGIVISPQRGDTIKQIGSTKSFRTWTRDSVGALSGNPSVNWTVVDTTIADISTSTPGSVVVIAKAIGTTHLRAVSQSNPNAKDSVPVFVALPPVNTCLAGAGSLHQSTTYTSPQVWTAAANPHFVNGSLTFNSGSRLTLEPGALVCMNPSAGMTFRAGSRLMARGTATQPIRITAATGTAWNHIQFGDVFSYTGTSTDTSVITNAVVERAAGLMLEGREQHALVMDSVTLRAATGGMTRLQGPGSRLSRSTVDTVANTSGSTAAVFIGRGTIEQTSIHNGANGGGIQITEAGVVRNVSILGGTQGLSLACCTGGAQINDVTIDGPTGVAIDLQNSNIALSSGNVQITGGTGGSYRGTLGNLGILFPDSLKQNTLKANGRGDTVFVTGGTLTGTNVVVRPDLPWLLSGVANVDTLSQLIIRPGARIAFQNAWISFQSGGTLDARGEAGKPITLVPFGTSGPFYGLQFNSPGPGPNPATQPTATSQLAFVRIDSAQGVGTPGGSLFCCSAAINSGDRHKVLIDSLIIHKAFQGAVFLSTPGSELKRALIDTTGTVNTNFASSYVAVGLGTGVLMQSSVVRRSGNIGVHASGAGARMQNVRIVGSSGVGLQADNAILAGDLGTVKVDSANAYPFRGRIENLAVLAPDSISQASAFLLGAAATPANVDQLIEITGGTLTGTATLRTLTAIPQIRWQVTNNQPVIDTLAEFAPKPGARLTFWNGGLLFQRGGKLTAVGLTGRRIMFQPAASGVNFYGLQFSNPGAGPNPALAPTAVSTLAYVQLDSAQGQGYPGSGVCCGPAAIHAGDHHRLLMDSVVVRKAHAGAVWMSTPGSQLANSQIDTTGLVNNGYVTTQAAVALGAGAILENTRVLRSGNVGVYAPGTGVRLTNVRIAGSQGVGLNADAGTLVGDLGSVKADSGNAYAFRGTIQNLAALAPDSISQAASFLLGSSASAANVDQLIEITGGSLVGTTSLRTMTAIPQIRWQVTNNQPVFDTLAQFAPRPGARLTFVNSGMLFQRGGTLNATGLTGRRIVFQPASAGVNFYGLQFTNPGAGPNPATAPTALSTLAYVQLDSAQGQGYPGSGVCCGPAAIHAGDHHRLMMDSVIVRKAHAGAVWMSTPGSQLANSQIDTTGVINNGYVTTQAAVGLGAGTILQNTRVLRSGNVGVYAPGAGVRLANLRIAASQGVGLNADGGTLVGDLGTVKADSGNAYPFRGTIQNLAVLAPDSATQASAFLLGASATPANVDQVIEITGGNLAGAASLLTLTAIPQVRWQITNNQPVIDTLAEFAPRPGARLTFWNSGMLFQRSGRLTAVGAANRHIVFQPAAAGVNFYGLQFTNPGAGGLPPASAPIATSTLSFVQLDSAQGQGYPGSGICCGPAAIHAGDHHRLMMDSVVVRKAHSGAVWMSTPGSQMIASRVDTTGLFSNGYTTTVAAVALGAGITLQNSRVLRSGNAGVYAPGVGVRLANVRIAASQGVGLNADAGTLLGDLGTVRSDSANAYPFRGTIQNLALLAPDSLTQAASFLLGPSATPANVDQVIEITGGTLAGTTSPVTITAIPQVRWQVTNNQPVFDTLAQFAPRPGARLTFWNSGLLFQHGGTINAIGASGRRIVFQPAAAGVNFYGLQFSNPGAGGLPPASAPIAVSTLSYVQLDSAQGQAYTGTGVCCGPAAIHAGDHHQLLMDSLIVRKAHTGAVWMSTPGSTLTASRIDTTGLFSNGFTTSTAAVTIVGGVSVTSTSIRRSGNTGLVVVGTGVDLTGTRIVASQNRGLELSTGTAGGTFSSFAVDSTAGIGVAIASNAVTISSCDVHRGFSHGIATTNQYTGAAIHDCNIVGNAARAVNNFDPTQGTYVIDATLNWWGFLDGTGAPAVPAVGAVNGPSANVTTSARAIRLPSGNPNP